MNGGKIVTTIAGGVFAVAMIGLLFSSNGVKGIRDFFGGLGYDVGVAGAPVTGRIPSYPS